MLFWFIALFINIDNNHHYWIWTIFQSFQRTFSFGPWLIGSYSNRFFTLKSLDESIHGPPENQLNIYAQWHFFHLSCKYYFDPIPSLASSWIMHSALRSTSERNVLEGMMLFSRHKFLNTSVHIFPSVISVLTCSTLEWKWSKALLIFMLFVRKGNGWIPQAVHFL